MSTSLHRTPISYISHTQSNPHHFRFVLSPGPTIASRAFTKGIEGNVGDTLEVCPEAVVMAENMSKHIEKNGGAALIIDYGEDKMISESLRV